MKATKQSLEVETCLENAAVGYDGLCLWAAGLGAGFLHGLDHIQTRRHLAEDHVLPVEPGRVRGADEELDCDDR